MKVHVIDSDDLEFASVAAADIDLRVDTDNVRNIVRAAVGNAHDPSRTAERSAWAIVAIIGHARLGETYRLDGAALVDVAEWMRGNLVGSHTFWHLLHSLLPRAVPDLALAMVAARPTAVAWAYAAATMAESDIRAEVQLRIAGFPLASVREHFFALLGQHRRLMPPGSISSADFAPDVLADVLRAGVTDPVPAVRERAIAVAIGMNAVRLVGEEVLARLDDPDVNVRQYALVALGTLDDAASLARLYDKLDAGTQEEMTSAIWGLARRPDGLARVLALATDGRDWVIPELLGALADVAALMTDAQIAALTHALADPRLPRVIERHLRRARDGGPEHGADGSWFVVRTAADPKPAPGS